MSNRASMIFVGCGAIIASGPTTLLAAGGACGVPAGMTDYVAKSRELVAQGVPLEEVLDVLACLARPISGTQGLPPRQVAPARRGSRRDGKAEENPDELARMIRFLQSPRAVRAIFQLCDSDACIRRYLLDIAADRATASDARGWACRLLVYVADAEVRDRLLTLAKEEWGKSSRFSEYANALQDLGSKDFLRWLDSTVEKGLEDGTLVSHRVSYLRGRARHIRIQQDPESILDYLASFDGSMDPSWAVRQACRHGVSASRIRSAVLSALTDGENGRNKRVYFEHLLTECLAMGLLTREEAKAFRAPRQYTITGGGKRRPTWEDSKIDAKRRAFWRLDRLNNSLDE